MEVVLHYPQNKYQNQAEKTFFKNQHKNGNQISVTRSSKKHKYYY